MSGPANGAERPESRTYTLSRVSTEREHGKQRSLLDAQKSYIAENYRFFGLNFLLQIGLSSTTLMYLAPKATQLREITQNNSYYAVQRHSRSPILVPLASLYAAFYVLYQ